MPGEGISRRDYHAAKFGNWERSLALHAQLTEVGRAEGIPFAFEKIERTPDTLDAHRLILLADLDGVQEAVVGALFRAYFTEGWDLGQTPTLLEVAAEAGLERGRTEELLRGDEGLTEVHTAEEHARHLGVLGVPFFIINSRGALSGAERCPFICRRAVPRELPTPRHLHPSADRAVYGVVPAKCYASTS